MFEDLSRIIDHQLYLALKQSLEESRGERTDSAAGEGGDGAGRRRDGGDGEDDGSGTRSEEGSDGISAPPASDDTPPGRSPVRHPGGAEGGGSRRSNNSPDWDRGRDWGREGDDAVVAALARLGLGGPGEDVYSLSGDRSRVRGGSSSSSGGEEASRGRSMLRRGRHRRRPYRKEENEDEEGEDDGFHENNWSPARAWENHGGEKLKLRPFRPPAVEAEGEKMEVDEEDIYGATPLASPGALERRRDGAPPHHPIEEGDIHGTTSPFSARSPEGLHNILPQLPNLPIDKNIYKFGASQPPKPLRDPVPSRQFHPPHPPPPPPAEPESEPAPDPLIPPIPPTNPPRPPLPDPSSDPTNTSSFPAITSLTLIAEDVPELVAFYTAVFADDAIDLLPGADAESASLALGGGFSFSSHSSSFPSYPAVPGPLVVHLLSSGEARRRRALGPHVHVGRRRDGGRRLLLGVRVRGLDKVYERLLALEKGGGVGRSGEEESGLGGGGGGGGGVWPWGWGWRARKGGMVNELTAPAERSGAHIGTDLRGRRSVMFWDPAGHCWEVWEESPGRVV